MRAGKNSFPPTPFLFARPSENSFRNQRRDFFGKKFGFRSGQTTILRPSETLVKEGHSPSETLVKEGFGLATHASETERACCAYPG